jgi:predicted aspartyl protease
MVHARMRFLLLFAIFGCFLHAFAASADAATEIPMVERSGFIFVKVRVAGQGTPLNFLLDSGAGTSALSLRQARRLGCKFTNQRAIQDVQGFSTAYSIEGFTASVQNIPVPSSVLAIDLTPVDRAADGNIDGLLGMDFFRGRIVQIDYAAGKVRLLSRDEISTNGAQIVPLAAHRDALCVRVGVNGGNPEWMRFDTGCSSALEWAASRKSWPRKLANPSIAAAGGANHSIRTDVAIGSEHFSDVKTGLHDEQMFGGESGLLGNGLLSHLRVTVDADKSRLILKRID